MNEDLVHATISTAAQLVREVRALAASTAPQGQRLEALRTALDGFVTGARVPRPETWPNTTGRYTRVLLNHPEDPFQVVVVFWPPGSRSAIHDHDETLGAVMPLFGELSETRYAVDAEEGECVALSTARVQTLQPHSFAPITRARGWQLHDMVNASMDWAATVHVYLRRIDRFRTFAARPYGSYRATRKQLWFDYTEGWRTWDSEPEPRWEGSLPLVGQGRCLCGATRFRFDGAPACQLVCHCTDCQRSTGSASAPLAFYAASTLEILSGTTRRYEHRNDSGHSVGRDFCATCGTTLFHTSSSSPHLAAVLVGTLDDSRGFRPTTEIYVGSAPHWNHLAGTRITGPAGPPASAAPRPAASAPPARAAASAP